MLKRLLGPTRYVLSALGREITDVGAPTTPTSAATKGYVDVGGSRITPLAFGATPYDPANEVDVSDDLQAFFDHAANPQNARKYVYDWSGDWMVSKTIYACYWDAGEPNVERKFIMGALRVAPLASLPGGVPLAYALEIAGLRMHWSGVCGIHPTGNTQYGSTYATRRYKRGVHIRAAGVSTFGDFQVDDCKRDGVHFEGWEAAFTVNGINFATANSIGCRVGRVYGRLCGSADHFGAAYAPATLVASAISHGYNSAFAGNGFAPSEAFTAGTAGQAGSTWQRTKITVPSTADIEILDMVWCRVELTPAIYGTVACADNGNGTGTITWTTGDPTNLNGAGSGLVVGDIYPPFIGGTDTGKEFRIVSFGGVSNRTVTVTPAPTVMAATANAAFSQYGKKSLHWVAQVFDATNFSVFPWVPARCNSPFHIITGAALKAEGDDLANVSFAGAMGLLCGTAYYGKGNYAPKVETLLAESCGIGLRLSDPIVLLHPGVHIEHGHVEACDFDFVSGSPNIYGTIRIESLFDLKNCVDAGPRQGINEQLPTAPFGLGYIKLDWKGGTIQTDIGGLNEGNSWDFYGISNAQRYRQVYCHTDTATMTVSFDRDEARRFPKHHWAEIIWTDSDGSSPDGTLTLNMDTSLAALGWTFAGEGAGTAYAITAPVKSVRLALQFIPSTKKVAITRSIGGIEFSATAKLLGRSTAGSGAAEEIGVTGGLTLTGGNLGLGAITPTSVAASGGAIGYATGAGGTVAQLTSKTTAVTLNKVCGQFATLNDALAAGATASFQVNNSNIAATDTILINLQGGQATNGTYRYWIEKVAAGSFIVTIENRSAGGLSEALTFNFAAHKAVTA